MATPIPDNGARFTADEIVRATGAETVGPARDVEGVVIDSRRARPGALFVALRGETHDAHEFVGDAARAGVAAVMVERDVDAGGEVAVYRVPSTRAALGALARAHRRRFAVPVVAITGSVGKTTTKELTRAALEGVGREVLATAGNLNNLIGLPMTLLGLEARHGAAVLEMGMSEPGEIAALAAIAEPSIGVVTAIAEVHTAGVGDLAGVAREKGALLEALPAEGVAIHEDDEERLAAARIAARRTTFGSGESATVRVESVVLASRRTRVRFAVAGREPIDVELALVGDGAARDAAAALAVVAAIDPERLAEAARALAAVRPVEGRLALSELPSGALLVDDTYNASPRSVREALRTAAALAEDEDRTLAVVLGDMLELGDASAELHAGIGRAVVEHGARVFVACGPEMNAAGRAALGASSRASGPRPKLVLVREVDAACEAVRELVAPRDVVLVKGLRGMRMERVVVSLREAPR